MACGVMLANVFQKKIKKPLDKRNSIWYYVVTKQNKTQTYGGKEHDSI